MPHSGERERVLGRFLCYALAYIQAKRERLLEESVVVQGTFFAFAYKPRIEEKGKRMQLG